MDITSISKVYESADTAAISTTTDTEKQNTNPMIENAQKVASDPNLGQNLDVIADEQIDEKEELNKQRDKQVQQEMGAGQTDDAESQRS